MTLHFDGVKTICRDLCVYISGTAFSLEVQLHAPVRSNTVGYGKWCSSVFPNGDRKQKKV